MNMAGFEASIQIGPETYRGVSDGHGVVGLATVGTVQSAARVEAIKALVECLLVSGAIKFRTYVYPQPIPRDGVDQCPSLFTDHHGDKFMCDLAVSHDGRHLCDVSDDESVRWTDAEASDG